MNKKVYMSVRNMAKKRLQDISPQLPTRPRKFGTTRPILLLVPENNLHLYQTLIK